MKSLLSFGTILAALFLVGCVRSTQPFVQESQAIYDPSLVGTWTDGESNTIIIKGDEPARSYTATLKDKEGKAGHFTLHLAKVQEKLLLDIAPLGDDLDQSADVYKSFLLPVHSFFLVEKTAGGMSIRTMEADWLKKLLTDHPDAIPHARADGDSIILTASTEQIQDFVLKHIDTDGAYGKPGELKRVDAPATAPAAEKP